MIRFSSLVALTALLVVTACKDDEPTKTVDTVDQGASKAIACGKDSCHNDDFCCGSTGWGDAACAVDCGTKSALSCDDATDCQTGSVCCYIQTNGSVTSTQCLTACPEEADRGQLCHAGSTECSSGTTCKALAVAPAGLFSCAN